MCVCVCVCAGEAHRVAGRRQRPSDECPDAAEGALQHADPQRHLAHQPHQTADHRERRVQEQQQLLDGRRALECLRVCVYRESDARTSTVRACVDACRFERLRGCTHACVFFFCFVFKKRELLEDMFLDADVRSEVISRKRRDFGGDGGITRRPEEAGLVHMKLKSCPSVPTLSRRWTRFKTPASARDEPLYNHTQ